MEAGKVQAGKTTFNTDIEKQFIPYWNGLLHLVARVDNENIVRRYDWDRIVRDCEDFEKRYMNTSGFCESCAFYTIPSYLDTKISPWRFHNCKRLAQDNDVLFLDCKEKQDRLIVIVVAIILVGLSLIIGGVLVWYYRESIFAIFNKTFFKMKNTYTEQKRIV
jgi:hypothetical protein